LTVHWNNIPEFAAHQGRERGVGKGGKKKSEDRFHTLRGERVRTKKVLRGV